ncbi:MAG: radical SAM protein [Alistipes sp.]|nr:radical SAM protein [Alistipes sp.]
MKIGLIDVDGGKFPNYALMKIAAYHKALGDTVEWADPMFGKYDKVYKSKIFTFSPDNADIYNCEIERGGTGYDLHKELPPEIDNCNPDYSIYPYSVDHNTAYGFLTRGCPNKCPWCVVPIKEGKVRPYRDVEEIAINGRTNLILMDNNILASDYGLQQIEKIVDKRFRVDFNQALDARLITNDIAELLAKVRWLAPIRLGCDTPRQIEDCETAMRLIDQHRGKPAQYLMYAMIGSNMVEAYGRLSYFRDNKRVRIVAQPYRDFNNPQQVIPQWQKDMARWAMRREIYASCDFEDYEPRKGFKCSKYFNK